MESFLTFILLVIAACWVSGRPLNIQLTYSYPQTTTLEKPLDPELQKKIDEEAQINLDNVISVIQDAMGVERIDDRNQKA